MSVTPVTLRCSKKLETSHGNQRSTDLRLVLSPCWENGAKPESDLVLQVWDRKEFDAFEVGAKYTVIIQRQYEGK